MTTKQIDIDFAERNGLERITNTLHALTNDPDSFVKERAYRGIEVYEKLAKGEYDRLDLASYVNENKYLQAKADEGTLTPSELKCYNAVHLASRILINELVKEQIQLSTVIKQINNVKALAEKDKEDQNGNKVEDFPYHKGIAGKRVIAINSLLEKHPLDLLWTGYKEDDKTHLADDLEENGFDSRTLNHFISVINEYRLLVGIEPIQKNYVKSDSPLVNEQDSLTSLPKVKLTTAMFYDYLLNEYIFNNLEILENAKRFSIALETIHTKQNELQSETIAFTITLDIV